MKNVLEPLAESVLNSSGLTTAALARNAAIQKTKIGSGETTLMISNEEMNDIMKLVKSLEESGLLTAAALARDAAIHKTKIGSRTTTLLISNEEMNDIMKLVKSLEESGLEKQLKMKQRIKKEDFAICY